MGFFFIKIALISRIRFLIIFTLAGNDKANMKTRYGVYVKQIRTVCQQLKAEGEEKKKNLLLCL